MLPRRHVIELSNEVDADLRGIRFWGLGIDVAEQLSAM